MSGGGGGNNHETQQEYNLAQWEHQWQQMNVAHKYREDTFAIQRDNQRQTIDVQNETAYNSWVDNKAQLMFDYNNQVEASNASKIAAGRQLEMNELASTISMNDNRRVLNDRLNQISFQNQELLLGHKQKKEQSVVATKELLGKHKLAKGRVNLTKEGVDVGLDAKKAEGALNKLSVAQGVRSAAEVAGLNARGLVADLQRITAETSAKARESKTEMYLKTGTILASGQTGRSARRAYQSAMANHGQANAMLVDSLARSTTQHRLNFDKIDQTLRDVKQKGELNVTKISNSIVAAGNEAIIARKGADLDLDAANLTKDIGQQQIGLGVRQSAQTTRLGQQQLKASSDSAEAQFTADNQRVALDKRQADIQAKGMIQPLPKKPIVPSKPVKVEYPTVMDPPPLPSRSEYDKTRPVKGSGGGSNFLGMALQLGGIFIGAASDDRFKYDITRVGTSPSGIPKYTFKYRVDGKHGPKYMGTSAQDLLAIGREDAVEQKEKDGFYYVNYSKLDVDMEVVTT